MSDDILLQSNEVNIYVVCGSCKAINVEKGMHVYTQYHRSSILKRYGGNVCEVK